MARAKTKQVKLDDGYYFSILKDAGGLFKLSVVEFNKNTPIKKWEGPSDGRVALCEKIQWITNKIYDVGYFNPEWGQCKVVL